MVYSKPSIPRSSTKPSTLFVGGKHQYITGIIKNDGVQTACAAATLQSVVVETEKHSQSGALSESYTLSDFELGEVLGVGQQGTVRKAVHLPTGKELAAKLLPKNLALGMNPGVLKKMRGEAAIMAGLQHCPSVVKFVTTAEDDDHFYIFTELLGGGSLQEKIDGENLREEDAREIMHGVFSFLALCHADRIAFGDIKPANFMLASNKKPQVKAIDFGCSQKMVPGLFLRARVGSPSYMAPEVHLGAYGLESDMWSAGVMLFQLLTGKLPFVREEKGCIVEAGLHLGYSFDGDEWSGISQDAQQLVASLLVRDRKQRLTANQVLGNAWFHGASSIVEFSRKPELEDKKHKSGK